VIPDVTIDILIWLALILLHIQATMRKWIQEILKCREPFYKID